MGIAAGIGAAGSLIGGVSSAAGALSGGGKAASGAGQSQYLQAVEMNQNIANSAPFIGTGQYAANQLQDRIASGAIGTPMDLSGMPAPFTWNPTMAGLAATPGYQFQLQQGLMAQQNSASARGLGVSSAALRGAADYAEGLAGTTYNQQLTNAINTYNTQMGGFQNKFSDYWANQTNQTNPLLATAQLGSNAAVGQGSNTTLGAANIGNAALAGGQAQGAGTQGAFNALGGALSSAQVQTAFGQLFGGGSTVSPQTVANNQTYQQQQFAANPGQEGPFQ